ncbi:unnamed protein product, partial [Iphiclides podalirius]
MTTDSWRAAAALCVCLVLRERVLRAECACVRVAVWRTAIDRGRDRIAVHSGGGASASIAARRARGGGGAGVRTDGGAERRARQQCQNRPAVRRGRL